MKITDNVQVFPSENNNTNVDDILYNPIFPKPILLQSNNQDSDYGTTISPRPEPIQDNGNVEAPLLITPVIDAPNVPIGSGSSIVLEPKIIEPIVKDVPATLNPVKSPISSPILNGGTIGGSSDSNQLISDKPKAKKPNYILYIGILLALVITYKVLTKKGK